MYTIDYLQLMRQLKLSQHPNQLIKRLRKYPAHIKHINGVWCVTPEYAHFLTNNQILLRQGQGLKQPQGEAQKGGAHE